MNQGVCWASRGSSAGLAWGRFWAWWWEVNPEELRGLPLWWCLLGVQWSGVSWTVRANLLLLAVPTAGGAAHSGPLRPAAPRPYPRGSALVHAPSSPRAAYAGVQQCIDHLGNTGSLSYAKFPNVDSSIQYGRLVQTFLGKSCRSWMKMLASESLPKDVCDRLGSMCHPG